MKSIIDDNPKTPRRLQELARLQMITRLERDILIDMQACEIEGWDKMEYIGQLRDLLNNFGRK